MQNSCAARVTQELMKNPKEFHAFHALNAEENAWFNYQRSLPVKTPIPHVRGEISCSLKETFSVSVTSHNLSFRKISFHRISSRGQLSPPPPLATRPTSTSTRKLTAPYGRGSMRSKV